MKIHVILLATAAMVVSAGASARVGVANDYAVVGGAAGGDPRHLSAFGEAIAIDPVASWSTGNGSSRVDRHAAVPPAPSATGAVTKTVTWAILIAGMGVVAALLRRRVRATGRGAGREIA